MKTKKPNITEVVLRDGQQSLIATRMKTKHMIPVLSKLDKVGYSSLEVWGGATYDVCLRFLNEDPWERLKIFKKYFKKTKLQMLLRGKNLVGYKKYHDSVISLFISNSIKKGINIFRIFDSLNDINNLQSSIKYVNKGGQNSQGTICYTTSPVHNEKYWLKLAKDIEDIGATSLAIKDMAGLLRPQVCYSLIKKLKSNLKIPIHLHTHATTGLADATNFKAFEAGVDNIDTSISSFSNLYSHTATESFISMLYDDESNPFDMKLLTEISEHFHELRPEYEVYEGSMKGVDINMLINQVPGGMLSILEKQLLDLDRSDKLKQLIDEIPKIREDVGYVPLVTPSSQIVGAQALMNVLDEKRYKTLTKEFVDLVNGEYGKVPGKICPKLLKRVENSSQTNESDSDLQDVDFYKNKFKKFCIDNYLSNLFENNSHLLNYILFSKESEQFYLSNNKKNMNDIIGLQEGFGLYINE
ncbi:MAG: oxaloacetate decarboxylase [Gammaproteobacteria bacterium]|nr:oxaloacetate decarboxylase [Gammaproteobacteria bacterium]|tara:strand:- start:1218 stop:2627 length:1410 start_codon:yes stop_codon:yes gene_type:complete